MALERKNILDVLAGGESPADTWRVGTEYETFAFGADPVRRLSYEDPSGGGDIRSLLDTLHREDGVWARDLDGEFLIGLHGGGCSITLEPGGQFELSGAPLSTVHEMKAELISHLGRLSELSAGLDVRWCWAGMDPVSALDDVPWMPKRRYRIMRDYLPSRGALATRMMKATCTVQANLDYADEDDMGSKLRVSLGLSSIVAALFANSPLSEGKPTGRLSTRSHVWTLTDPDRCGLPAWAFDGALPTYERYVDYALQIPLFFLVRDGTYLDCSGLPFTTFMQQGFGGHEAHLDDWHLHLSTLFPDVRVKTYLETRSADCVSPELLPALPALWKGVLYDEDARCAAWDLVRDWTMEERLVHRDAASRDALAAAVPRGRYQTSELALELLRVARYGLERQSKKAGHADESVYLDPLEALAEGGRCPADQTLEDLGSAPSVAQILSHYDGSPV